jgi:hypothetical protein
VEASLSLFGDSANLAQDWCVVCAQRTIGSEFVLNAPDGTPRRVGHVESRFGPFGDSISVGVRWVHGLRQTYHRLINRFGRTRWYSEGGNAQVEARLVLFVYSANLDAR